jgi:arabinofuranosyltransferase
MRIMRRSHQLLAAAAGLALFVGFTLHFRGELIDDAYISLTYARHLAQGNGLVWNPGERVEGYTDFLWVILLSLTGATPAAARALAFVAGAVLVWVIATLPRDLVARRPALALLPILVAAHLSFAFWTAKGLETALFALLLTAGLFRCASASRLRESLLGIHLLSLAALTRPEGLLFVALAVAYTLRSVTRDAKTRALVLVFPVALLAPHLVFRLAYYGYFLPNTYYVKVGASIDQWLRGLDYLVKFLAFPGAILLAAIFAFPRAMTPAERFLTIALLAGVASVVYVGGDAFGANRFLVPLLPVMGFLAISGFHRVLERLAARAALPGSTNARSTKDLKGAAPAGPRIARIAPIVITLILAISSFAASWGPVRAEEAAVTNFTRLMIEVGRLIKENTPEHFTIALNPAGAVPYYAERRAIDMLGLNDEHIAHSKARVLGSRKAGHEKGDGAYVLSRRPNMILIGNVWVDESDTVKAIYPSRQSEVQIMKTPDIYERYELVFFPLGDGRSLKALVLREGTSLPECGWGPKNFRSIPKEKWQ